MSPPGAERLPPEREAAARRERVRPWRVLEPCAFIALVLLYIWVVQPTRNDWLRIPCLLVIVLIPVASAVLHKDTLRDMGVRLDNLRGAAIETGAVTFGVAAAILAAGYAARGGLNFPPEALGKLLLYPFWGLAQQYVMQAFVYRRLREGLGSVGLAGLVTAGLFAAAHWPNGILTAMTFCGGLIWCRLFERKPNLFVLALSHGIIAVLLFYVCPEEWLRHLRIGPRYYR